MPSERRHVNRATPTAARTSIGLNPMLLPALAACCVPTLLAYNLPPSPTVFNQLAAVAGWGLFVMAGAALPHAPAARTIKLGAPLALALLLVALAALWSSSFGTLPASLGWPAIGLIAATVLTMLAGAAVQSASRADVVLAFCAGCIAAGVLGAAIGLVQVFAPEWSDGNLVASSSVPGRAVGNLRQPNHLSSLLLWGAIALVPWLESGRLPRAVAVVAMLLLMAGVELTGSRTGLIGVALLGLWGIADRRLSGPARWLLLGAPLAYGVCTLLLALHTSSGDASIGVAAKLAVTDISSSRFGIWANTLALIATQPWTGVGFGQFNIAWTLTPFPGRPVAFFDHTHNVALQLVVELGVPLATAVLALMAWALWRAWRGALAPRGIEGACTRALFVMVLMMALHSQLEYPLWYAYFLLPTAWAWGVCLGATSTGAAPDAHPSRRSLWPLAGMLMVAGAGLALADYLRVVRIFAPPADAAPLAQRIADGEQSVLFGHHADYAAATTSADTNAPQLPGRARHYLLDARLMMAWANALAVGGDLDRATYLAQRLREFNNPQAAEFFEVCNAPGPIGPKLRYRCDNTPRPLGWQDFLR